MSLRETPRMLPHRSIGFLIEGTSFRTSPANLGESSLESDTVGTSRVAERGDRRPRASPTDVRNLQSAVSEAVFAGRASVRRARAVAAYAASTEAAVERFSPFFFYLGRNLKPVRSAVLSRYSRITLDPIRIELTSGVRDPRLTRTLLPPRPFRVSFSRSRDIYQL